MAGPPHCWSPRSSWQRSWGCPSSVLPRPRTLSADAGSRAAGGCTMKTKTFLTGLIAVLALALVSAACGGDDGGEQASIRTQKGLAVAAISGPLGGDQTGTQTGASAVPNTDGDDSETAHRSS